jgi:hypothetical protein
MFTLAKESERYFMDYERGGGKENRKKRVQGLLSFLIGLSLTRK